MSFQNSDEIEDALKSPQLTVRELYVAWEQRQPVPQPGKAKSKSVSDSSTRQIPWLQGDLELARLFTERALNKEEFLLVCDGASETLRHWTGGNGVQDRPELVRIGMNYAAALTRLGFTRDARLQLQPYLQDDAVPLLGRGLKVELFLQMGDILREEAHRASARAARLQKADEALEFYQRALQLDPCGLKALVLTAAASLYTAEPSSELLAQAHAQARQVLELTKGLEDSVGPRIDTTGSRAIAQAILGQIDEAAESYSRLHTMRDATTRFLADARYNAQFLAEALGQPLDLFKKAFPPLELIVFAGHMPDRPGTARRFPAELIEPVREILAAKLKEIGARVGLVGAAAGSDLLFCEALRKLNGDVHLVLPWSRDEFRQTTIESYEPAGSAPVWGPLFERALHEAATLREIGQTYSPSSDVGWQYITEVTAGLALHTARVSRLDVKPMVLWDGRPGRAVGGTASFAEFWHHELQQEVLILDMPDQPAGPPLMGEPQNPRSERSTLQQEVKSMLFADIVGYSKLTEAVIPEFVETFMGRVAQLAAASRHAPISINTWGDAVYAVFDYAQDAGSFALELTRMIHEGEPEWLQKGLYWSEAGAEGQPPLKHPLNIRVGLHTGPVFMHYNPVVRQLGFTGAHVNRAARIEPVARPGEVFASEEFAALAELGAEIELRNNRSGSAAGGSAFICEYAGSMNLAKGYPGRFRIYRVVANQQLVVDELARAVHELYCAEARLRGESVDTNSVLRSWELLEESLKEANRAQVADIPNKLRLLGYELAPNHGLHPSEITIPEDRLEELSIREHDRWMRDRRRNGWTFAAVRDNSRKYHPMLVPWEQLSEPAKQLDRDAVRNVPVLLEKAGFRVRKK